MWVYLIHKCTPSTNVRKSQKSGSPPKKIADLDVHILALYPTPSPSKMLWMTGLSWLKVDILLPNNAIRYGETLSICNKPVLVNFDHFLEFELKNSCGRPHFTGWPPPSPHPPSPTIRNFRLDFLTPLPPYHADVIYVCSLTTTVTSSTV